MNRANRFPCCCECCRIVFAKGSIRITTSKRDHEMKNNPARRHSRRDILAAA
jgi:hypothetical protein